MVGSDKLLEQIAAAWTCETVRHRDAMLAMGRQLQEFVIVGLEERDQMRPVDAEQSSITRKSLTKRAADRLKVTRNDVNAAIRRVAIVDLLSNDGQLGDMPYRSIIIFAPMIERVKGSRKHRHENTPARDAEKWVVKEDYPRAAELFQKAVTDGLLIKDVFRLVYEYMERRPAQHDRKISVDESMAINDTFKVFRRCSARDACEQLKEMIVNSAEPLLLGSQLVAFLESHEFTSAVKERERNERIASRRQKQTVGAS